MSQERIHDEAHDSSAKYFNQKFRDIIGKFVLDGFGVEKGTAALKVTVHSGKAILDGVEIIESQDMADALTLDPPHVSLDRFDIIALKYLFNETFPPNEASLVVVKGTPSPNPQKPALASDELELATIRVRGGSSDIQNSDIAIPLKLRSRLHDLVHSGVTTERKVFPFNVNVVTWDTDEDPRTLGLDVQHGDGWTPKSENPPIVRMYDAFLGEWIEKDHWDNIRGKQDEYPPEKHDFYGDRHYGDRPLPEKEHNMENDIHQAIAAISLVFAF